MSNLYAETTDKLADYLWWLLPNFFKRKAKHESCVFKFLTVFGKQLEDIRENIIILNNQFTAETASGRYLNSIGKARGTYRLQNETDNHFRNRIMNAYIKKQKAGTKVGMIEGLAAFGFDTTIMELYKTNKNRWSEFIVKINAWDGITSQNIFYAEVNRLKPAHTRMVADPMLDLDVFDSNENLDENYFDGWDVS